jgi:nucleoid-associated protein EbfC
MANGNMNQIMKQAQAMQRKLTKAQEELAQEEVTGSAGGGMVSAVVAGGGGEVKSVTINPDAVDPDDVEMLQDMVVAAVNEGLRAAKELEEERLGGLTQGLGLPPGLV